MKYFRRLFYIAYYLKQLNWQKLQVFMDYVIHEQETSKIKLWTRILLDSLLYNISILEFFQFGFYKKQIEKRNWAGTGYMYEYQLIMNPSNKRGILDDKTKFYKHYSQFFKHLVADIADLKKQDGLAEKILGNPSGKIVFKIADGKCGDQVVIKPASQFNKASMIHFMETEKYDLVEEFIIQHSELNRLSPSAVNTVRIFTQLNTNNEVEILGCRQRISINSPVDNMAAGNIAAPIDEQTGVISGQGVYSDITKSPESVHPITGVKIEGFQIPYWQEIISMIKKAALLYPQNRSIGWDIVVTENGPGLIEGNHDWCKLVYQLPVGKGLKPILERHLSEFKLNNFTK